MHYHATTDTFIARPPKSATVAGVYRSDFDLAGAKEHAAARYFRVAIDTPEQPPGTVEDVGKRVVEIEGTECRVARTWIAAPVVEPDPPPPQVIAAALALQAAVATVNATYGSDFGIGDGYEETYEKTWGANSKIPLSDAPKISDLLKAKYGTLEYRINNWKTGVKAWDMLPALAAALHRHPQVATPRQSVGKQNTGDAS